MSPDPETLARYRRETGPGPDAVHRLVRSVRAARRPSRAPVAWTAGLGLAVAATALWFAWPRPAPVPAGPLTLWSPEVPQVTPAADGVALTWQGGGQLDGARLQWETGEVSVEVPPDRGLAFEVRTREATVRVVGTGFSVRRDALGTTVAVRHGRVEVACGGEAPVALDAGMGRTCAPVSASGLLARARRLREEAPAEARAAVEAGLSADPAPAIGVELRWLRAELRLAEGDAEGARADLDAILAEGESARADDARRLLDSLGPPVIVPGPSAHSPE